MSGTTLTAFTPGDLVISVYGAANGTGTYTLDQASAITLEELTPAGVVVGNLVLPQTTMVVNGTIEYALSGEYGSASEGTLQLSVDGQSLVTFGYGVNAAAFNMAGASGNSAYGSAALGQSTSTTNGVYIPVSREVANIGYNAAIDTSTSVYNIYNTNNPRSAATVNGTTFYLSGQSVKGSTTQGLFLTTDGSGTSTAIDTSTDTRDVQVVNGRLYVSRDSTQGGTAGTSNIASYGATLPSTGTMPTALPGIAGQVTLTAAQANSVNAGAVGTTVNLSPYGFYFANATTLYVADGGFPKQGGIGDGGLQKWIFNGTTWTLAYTLSAGLSQVADTAPTGTTGLFGLTGQVVGNTVQLYATTSTAGELDPSYLYGISDVLSATTAPAGETFTQLMAAAPDSIIRGVSFAPTAANPAVVNTMVTSGSGNQIGLVVSSGSTLTVATGGTVTGATILSGGAATVAGSDIGGIIGHGGSETLTGFASAGRIDGTQTVSGSAAITASATIENGGTISVVQGFASSALVTSGGTLSLAGTGGASNATISGGTVVLAAPGASLTGTLTFTGPGTVLAAAIATPGSGVTATIAGFGVGDVIDDTAIGFTGAALATTLSGANTVATITSGGTSQSFVFAGAVASSLTLVPDAGNKAEIVFLPAPTTSMTVTSGMNLIVTSGSTLTVAAGGTVTGTTVLSGGMETVAGVESGTTLSAGGTETLLGSANADQIYGLQLVSSTTALVTNETVFNGGVINDFLKGAILTGTTVSSGGTLNISGNTTASNTVLVSGGIINLQSPKANVTGTLTFSGGGTLAETGTTSGGFGDLAVISGFGAGATIDVTTIAFAGTTLTSSVVNGNTVETITSGAVSQPFTFAGLYPAGAFVLGADSANGVQITAGTPCYCRGTLILTDRGEVAAETLAIGDTVVTASGAVRPVKWIGRRSYGGRFTSGNRAVLPVVIKAGAIADGVPRRDLWVSPLHAMFIDGLLIPARALINGTSITQALAVDRVDYIHIELDTHDVILAEGAPSETFIDDDSRLMFHNAREFARLYSDAPAAPAVYCAPRVEDGPMLEEVWQRLAGRIAA